MQKLTLTAVPSNRLPHTGQYRWQAFWALGMALIARGDSLSAPTALVSFGVLGLLLTLFQARTQSPKTQIAALIGGCTFWWLAMSTMFGWSLDLTLIAAAAGAVWFLIPAPGTSVVSTNQSQDPAQPVAPEEVSPVQTLPRWMSEFVDTYGMPTHLRTSRNYIEICNEGHSSYVRLSLTSAAQQIPKDMGLRIHKEYYVFRGSVKRHVRDNGRHLLDIGNDTHLPVGRSFLASVKAEGLIS